jgi:hypothetical protein
MQEVGLVDNFGREQEIEPLAPVVDRNVDPPAGACDIFFLDRAVENELVIGHQDERGAGLAADAHLAVIVIAEQDAARRHVAVDLGGAAAKVEVLGDDIALHLQKRRPVDVGFSDGGVRRKQRACDEECPERRIPKACHQLIGVD